MALSLLTGFTVAGAAYGAPKKNYEETVSEWKSYKDVAAWMGKNFSYDAARAREAMRNFPSMSVRTAKETFDLKSGVCWDAARFVKETLDRIDPSYEAQIVYIQNRPADVDHYVCSFKIENKLYIMDYGTYYKNMAGTHGPFDSLEDYKSFYEKNHPKVKKVNSISYGWPPHIKDKLAE